ncbi:hypothetical protein PF005_g2300 [Phytophthora fragariae]|uniref:Uncharacterized protein n=2 Tax=Phytophthora TaxID=4783 RepID=A0A6A4ADI4_9STRA|nr:hypothetical protein PF003_g13486 [Phytophthora fragariae]KAE8994505.1 hypothetical protein PR002_g19903 [Phytophthora rubi]KAE8942043.1 hypothetical protein PF009_g8182 [Phytophthora fragariae]KAE8982179.1 hypothetical protein PF011_g21720 [Phytophthora fragariae]KAE8998117.1 hypothetical protein PR001_g19414 [Phytophthora rubi]
MLLRKRALRTSSKSSSKLNSPTAAFICPLRRASATIPLASWSSSAADTAAGESA